MLLLLLLLPFGALLLVAGAEVTEPNVATVAADVAALATGAQPDVLNFDTFDEFRLHHNKTYLRPYNEERARRAFDDNRRFIEEHNAAFEEGERRFAVRANHLADMVGRPVKIYMRGEWSGSAAIRSFCMSITCRTIWRGLVFSIWDVNLSERFRKPGVINSYFIRSN